MSPKPVDCGLLVNPVVQQALRKGRPVVALESTVIAHGLPYPENVALARELESLVAERGAVPATIGVIDGRPIVGLTQDEIVRLATSPAVRKVSARDLPVAIGAWLDGATTVAATLLLAERSSPSPRSGSRAGIKVLSTGGIGGVHRGGVQTLDISADLPALTSTPMVVVCSGPKALVDAGLTLEWLETYGVPVVGYQTDKLPLFYVARSHLPLTYVAHTAEEIAAIAAASWRLGLRSAILVAVPVPPDYALAAEEVDRAVEAALAEADSRGIRGQQLTPFVLARLRDLTAGKSLTANLALLRNNAVVAAEVAKALAALDSGRVV